MSMRGRELPYTSAFGQRDAMEYMQECYADEGVDRSGELAVLVRAPALPVAVRSSTVTSTAASWSATDDTWLMPAGCFWAMHGT
jgi:hypothetical protein